MKKRFLGTLLAAALVVTQAVSVFAAGSKTTQATLSGESAGKYEVTEGTRESFSEVKEAAVLDAIMAVNEGTSKLEDLAATLKETAPEVAKELEGKTLATKFFDLKAIGDGVKTEDGKYKVTFTVPSLTKSLTEVKVLHYSTARSTWEVIAPEDVNYTTKEITAKFEDLSPVAVIGKNTGSAAVGSANSTTGTSPKTGVASDWALYVSASAVLLGAAVVVLGRNRKRA